MLEDLDSLNIGSLGGGRGDPMFTVFDPRISVAARPCRVIGLVSIAW